MQLTLEIFINSDGAFPERISIIGADPDDICVTGRVQARRPRQIVHLDVEFCISVVLVPLRMDRSRGRWNRRISSHGIVLSRRERPDSKQGKCCQLNHPHRQWDDAKQREVGLSSAAQVEPCSSPQNASADCKPVSETTTPSTYSPPAPWLSR